MEEQQTERWKEWRKKKKNIQKIAYLGACMVLFALGWGAGPGEANQE